MKHINKFNENISSGTRVLFVSGEDYSALSFEQVNKGALVSDIIDNIQDYESDEWELSVHEFGEIDPNFVKFIKNNIQYIFVM
jgi:hypothetical protein